MKTKFILEFKYIIQFNGQLTIWNEVLCIQLYIEISCNRILGPSKKEFLFLPLQNVM